MNSSISNHLALISIAAVAAATRLLPHPPNFTAVTAIALFAGARGTDLRTALAIPLLAMLLGDAGLAVLHYGASAFASAPWVYASVAGVALLGRALRRSRPYRVVLVGAPLGSLLFFAVTNFGVWWGGALYPRTTEGLGTCFLAALPFLRNQLAATLLFTGLALAAWEIAGRRGRISVGARLRPREAADRRGQHLD